MGIISLIKSKTFSGQIIRIILFSILLLSAYFIILNYKVILDGKNIEYIDKLSSIANTLSLQMEGDELEELFAQETATDGIKSLGTNPIYDKYHHMLVEAHRINKLNSPIYTLSFDKDKKNCFFGITSSKDLNYRHAYTTYPKELVEKYDEGTSISAYGDEHGTWISAFAPIKNSKGETIAVVQADYHFDSFKSEAYRSIFINIGIAILFIIVLMTIALRVLRKILVNEDLQKKKIKEAHETITEKHAELEVAKNQSERLLLNILPRQIAEELKLNGKVLPVLHHEVTVVFTDFTGFTTYTETLSAEELVEELNYCFYEFDKIVEKYNLEKLKTIGDAYMYAGGIASADGKDFDATKSSVLAAFEISEFIKNRRAEKLKEGKTYYDIKIGVHTGSVVAGVVGKSKFVYDIWGDSVNIAARMESNCEGGKVNVSKSTHDLLEKYKDLCFEYRGKINAKNKGMLDMFYVKKP